VNYERGQRFQLKEHVAYIPVDQRHPDPNYEAFLDRNHPIFAGQIGTVVEVVPPEVDGAGNHEEEHVVLSFEGRVMVGDDTDPENLTHEAIPGHPGRNVSFTQSDMDKLFTPVAVGAIEQAMQPVAGGVQ
jgi:hypothetical protein